MEFLTTDLFDEYGAELKVAAPVFRSFGKKAAFGGVITTVKCFEDNSLVKAALAESGEGKVLVVDGGGSLRCALLGDLLATSAIENQWEGIVVYGCIRDSREINAMPIGIKALATHPAKSVKNNTGERNIPVHFADVGFIPEQYLYADEDGIIVSPKALSADSKEPKMVMVD